MTYASRRKLKKRFGEIKVKKGRRTYGALHTRDEGSQFYISRGAAKAFAMAS
jgi:hypothetical protein